MSAVARISPIWRKQKLFVAIFLLAVGAWFFFDGAIGYPRANRRWAAWKQHLDEGRAAEWPAFAAQQGWKANEWDAYVREHNLAGNLPAERWNEGKRIEQFVLGGVAETLGLIVLVYWFTQLKRTLRSDEEAVYSPRGTRVPFTSIIGVGKKRWESKGIATVRYQIEGRRGQFEIDDYKFDTDAARKILAEIEEKLTATK